MFVKPSRAFVENPSLVASSSGSAKNARYARLLPSTRKSSESRAGASSSWSSSPVNVLGDTPQSYRPAPMPEIEVQPLEDEHLAGAAAVLAERHARHRAAEPLLPDVRDFRGQIERELARERANGVVALLGDEVVAYLVGAIEDDLLLGDRRAVVDFAGCAAADAEAVRDLYAALAARWTAAGCVRHAAAVPATDEPLIDAWLRLGFGVQFVWAVRETARMRPVEGGVEIRPGTPDDLDLVARLDRDLWELQSQSPSFSGLSVPGEDEFRQD